MPARLCLVCSLLAAQLASFQYLTVDVKMYAWDHMTLVNPLGVHEKCAGYE